MSKPLFVDLVFFFLRFWCYLCYWGILFWIFWSGYGEWLLDLFIIGTFWCWICLVVVSWLTIGVSFHSPLVYWFIMSLLKLKIVAMEIVCSMMEIVNYIVDRRSGCAWWRLGLCVPWVFFFSVDLLLRCGSFYSFFLFVGFPSFFFLSSGFSSFSRFVVFYSVYFEIECKRLEIYVAKTCPSQQVGSEFLKLKFYMELEFLKLEMLGCKHILYPC